MSYTILAILEILCYWLNYSENFLNLITVQNVHLAIISHTFS